MKKIDNKVFSSKWNQTCTVEGWPLPNIEWYHNGVLIPSNSTNSGGFYHVLRKHKKFEYSKDLIIDSLTSENSGVYTCVMDSGVIIKDVTLVVGKNAGM